jgi:hypothetical protein
VRRFKAYFCNHSVRFCLFYVLNAHIYNFVAPPSLPFLPIYSVPSPCLAFIPSQFPSPAEPYTRATPLYLLRGPRERFMFSPLVLGLCLAFWMIIVVKYVICWGSNYCTCFEVSLVTEMNYVDHKVESSTKLLKCRPLPRTSAHIILVHYVSWHRLIYVPVSRLVGNEKLITCVLCKLCYVTLHITTAYVTVSDCYRYNFTRQ